MKLLLQVFLARSICCPNNQKALVSPYIFHELYRSLYRDLCVKILFIADVNSWKDYITFLNHARPDIVMMGGDLVSDGGARFWNRMESLIFDIPELRKELLDFLHSHKSYLEFKKSDEYEKAVEYIESGYKERICLDESAFVSPMFLVGSLIPHGSKLHSDFIDLFSKLEQRARESPEFRDYVNDNHISKFYDALDQSSEICKAVFVVMGDHDYYDFPGAYSLTRINSYKNVHEISGKNVVHENLRILGLGFMETHYLQKLRDLSDLHQDKVDIILTHAEQKRMLELAAWIRPKIVLRGHFGFGLVRIKNVLVVQGQSMVETKDGEIVNADTWVWCRISKKLEKCTRGPIHCTRYGGRLSDLSGIIEREKLRWPWQERIFKNCPLRT